ncbi:MAG: HEAT repeat domain-containing protein [Candidatus Cloacimonetes bacterium]|nr:HEAT repeat domain-containing protein [Candidatus Cloacimonadota bacterium]
MKRINIKLFPLLLTIISFCFVGCFSTPKKDKPKKRTKVSKRTPKSKAKKASAPKTVAIKPLPKEYSIDRTILEMTQNLNSKDPRKKAHAITALQQIDHQDSIATIQNFLRDKNSTVLKATIIALAKFKDLDSLDQMYRMFSRKKDVRGAIIQALEYMQDDYTEEFLLKIMPRLNSSLSERAYKILQKIQEPKTFSGDSGRISLDSFSITGVIGKGKKAKIQVGKEFFGVGEQIAGFTITDVNTIEKLVTLEQGGKISSKSIDSGTNAIEKSIEKLNSDEDEVVYQGIMELAYYKSTDPSDELIALMKGKNSPDIKIASIYTLGVSGITKAEDSLKKILRNKKTKTDEIIVGLKALAQFFNEDSVSSIESFIQHNSPWVRNAAISAMGLLASQNGLASIVSALGDDFGFVRNNAYNQLYNFCQADLHREVRSILNSTDFKSKASNELKSQLIEYIGTFPSDGSTDQEYTVDPDSGEIVIPKKVDVYSPQFELISVGQFGSRKVANIAVAGEKKTVEVGEKIDGFKLTKIDLDDEVLFLDVSETKIAVVEMGDEGEMALVIEFMDK